MYTGPHQVHFISMLCSSVHESMMRTLGMKLYRFIQVGCRGYTETLSVSQAANPHANPIADKDPVNSR